MRRLRLRFVGHCQGVGFRWTSQRLATELGLTGWVRNEWDGSVSMELQGADERISQFFGQLQAFYKRMWVDYRIDQSEDVPLVDGEAGFQVRH